MKINRFQYMKYMAATNFTGTITKHRDDITLDLWKVTLNNGFISERSEAIVTYCLTGFSSFLSAALLGGILFTLAPKRKRWINGAVLPAVLAGHLANCMTGCFATHVWLPEAVSARQRPSPGNPSRRRG
ncbi:solute carrier family 28 member 3-like [Elysia marginata]|uniref:Solute carrier family 28 member 3-like n=1 Tax=Elysia marginata TaxID=1093978 RepID=A0AAV4H8X0_9GAST|nr:solute carrier family 28 member 3-like [Elysia marginata]